MRGIGGWKRECGLLGVFAAAAVLAVANAGGPAFQEAFSFEDRATRSSRELEERRVQLMGRQEGKLVVTRALVRREISLPEAARRLRDLVGDDPQTIHWMRGGFPGASSEEELFCRHAIRLAEIELKDSARSQAVVACLEAELRAHLERSRLRAVRAAE
jgi:hypothetical protein